MPRMGILFSYGTLLWELKLISVAIELGLRSVVAVVMLCALHTFLRE